MNTQQPAGCCTIGWRPEGREIKERGDTSWSRFGRFCKATSISERKSEGLSVCVCDQAKSLAVRETAWHQGWIIHPRLHPLKYWCPDNPLHISASHTVPSFFTFSHLQSFISTGNSFSSQTRTGKKQGNGNEYGSLGAGKLNLRDVTSFHLLFFHSHASFLSVLVDGGDRSIKANMRERDTVTQRENKRFQKWKGKENIWAGKEKEKDHGSERGRRNWTERRQSAEEELFHTSGLLWIDW